MPYSDLPFPEHPRAPVLISVFFFTGETIPIRLFLGGFDLTPTFRDVNKKFSVRYYLNLVLIDEENRRYFKQQEITVYRVPEVSNLSPTQPLPCSPP